MRFELTQRFASPVADVDDAYADAALYPTLVGLPKLGDIAVLRHERTGDRARMSIRFAFTGDLPSAVTAVVDPHRLTWVQETEHDLSSGITTFRLVPDHYPDRLSASGTAVVRPDGDGARRVVSGELKVRALLVSGKVEQAIVSGLAEYLEAEAPAVDRYLAG
jgi:hypothetical protein